MINKQPFTAPTEELELELIKFCIEVLNLNLGEFWYKWFPAKRVLLNKNHTLHIECNQPNLIILIGDKFPEYFGFEKFYEIRMVTLPGYCDFNFQYFIHFKSSKDLMLCAEVK